MNSTFATSAGKDVPNRAQGYDDNYRLIEAPDWPALRPPGGFLSTVLDLAKWDAVLNTDKILSESSRRQMWTPVKLNDGTSHPHGFGWQLEAFRNLKSVRHSGGMPGFRAMFARYPDEKLTIIFLMNLNDVDPFTLLSGLTGLYVPASASVAASGAILRNSN